MATVGLGDEKQKHFVLVKSNDGNIRLCSPENSADFELLGYDSETPVLSTKQYDKSKENKNLSVKNIVVNSKLKGEKLLIVNHKTGKRIEVPVARCNVVSGIKTKKAVITSITSKSKTKSVDASTSTNAVLNSSKSSTVVNNSKSSLVVTRKLKPVTALKKPPIPQNYELYINNNDTFSNWAKTKLIEPDLTCREAADLTLDKLLPARNVRNDHTYYTLKTRSSPDTEVRQSSLNKYTEQHLVPPALVPFKPPDSGGGGCTGAGGGGSSSCSRGGGGGASAGAGGTNKILSPEIYEPVISEEIVMTEPEIKQETPNSLGSDVEIVNHRPAILKYGRSLLNKAKRRNEIMKANQNRRLSCPQSPYNNSFKRFPKVYNHRFIQTTPTHTIDAQTNTDDSLLDFLIDEKVRERLENERQQPQLFGHLNQVNFLTEHNDDTADIINSLTTESLLDNLDAINVVFGDVIPNGISGGTNGIDNIGGIANNHNPFFNYTAHPINESQGFSSIATNAWKMKFFNDLKNCLDVISGNFPLHVAVIDNSLNMVKRQCMALRLRKFGIDMQNSDLLTPLQLALMHNSDVAIVETLLNNGANSTVLDLEGNNILHLAVSFSNDLVVRLLLSSRIALNLDEANFEGYSPLILAIMKNKYVVAKALLCCSADPNKGDKKSGRTALFHAVEANNVDLVKLLMTNKARPKLKNFFGTSPHDAMYELEDVDISIKKMILNKDEDQLAKAKILNNSKRKRKDRIDS